MCVHMKVMSVHISVHLWHDFHMCGDQHESVCSSVSLLNTVLCGTLSSMPEEYVDELPNANCRRELSAVRIIHLWVKLTPLDGVSRQRGSPNAVSRKEHPFQPAAAPQIYFKLLRISKPLCISPKMGSDNKSQTRAAIRHWGCLYLSLVVSGSGAHSHHCGGGGGSRDGCLISTSPPPHSVCENPLLQLEEVGVSDFVCCTIRRRSAVAASKDCGLTSGAFIRQLPVLSVRCCDVQLGRKWKEGV